MLIRIADATSFQSFDGKRSVFVEASQQLFELNDAAMAVLAATDQPVQLSALRDAISPAIPGGSATLHRLLVDWAACGLIELLPNRDSSVTHKKAALQLVTPAVIARLHLDHDDYSWLAPYSHLPSGKDEGFNAYFEVDGDIGLVSIEGGASRIVPRDLLPATLRYHLVEALLERNSSVALHCAVLVKNGASIVLMGPPGTGKSTMALFASREGFGIGCDDIAFLGAAGSGVVPLPLPLTLKKGSLDLVRAAGFEIDCSQIVPRHDGTDVLYLPVPNGPFECPIPIRAIIQLQRGGSEGAQISPWSKTECLECMCSEALSRSGKASVETFQSMLTMVERTETLTLDYAEAEQAARLLESHVAD